MGALIRRLHSQRQWKQWITKTQNLEAKFCNRTKMKEKFNNISPDCLLSERRLKLLLLRCYKTITVPRSEIPKLSFSVVIYINTMSCITSNAIHIYEITGYQTIETMWKNITIYILTFSITPSQLRDPLNMKPVSSKRETLLQLYINLDINQSKPH